ncbi:unnamed protein product [Pocillopora meandrina]|uniref:Uncharacterized protein n=1 Tax=Pocillopora meandrina TaxID=46732 RepID=A0AAU9X1G9_9CNID|nr:unnamed protein product [Pocillopora meandrina]
MTSPANNIAHTLFKQINFRANGTLLTEQVDMYHLKAFIQTILNYDRNDGETILEPAGWRNEIDSPVTYTAANVKMDDDAYTALSINHQESIKRQRAVATEYYAGGKRRILRMKPFIDAFHQGKWIVPKTLLELEFYLNPAALFMNGEANPPSEEVRVNPEDIKLTFFLCLVSLNPAVYMSMMSMMTKTPTKYPMIRTEMRQFPLDNGATSKEINNPFNGKVPQRVIIGILKTTAFNGQYNEDPLAFGKFGVEYIKQIVNGEEYPYETLELNTANGQKKTWWVITDFWMLLAVCTEMQETWCDSKTGVMEKIARCLRFPMWPMEDTMTRFFYLKMKASSTFTLNLQGKQVRKW